jgi:hypothetical protein
MGSTTSIMLLVAGTAILAALMTTGLLWLVGGRLVQSRLKAIIDTAAEVVAAKVRRAVLDAVEEALPQVRREVARGVGEAGETILPRLREQLRSGITEGVASALTGGAVSKAGEEILRKSGSVIDAGLDLILGPRKRDGDED